jgi:hypothetical protein
MRRSAPCMNCGRGSTIPVSVAGVNKYTVGTAQHLGAIRLYLPRPIVIEVLKSDASAKNIGGWRIWAKITLHRINGMMVLEHVALTKDYFCYPFWMTRGN